MQDPEGGADLETLLREELLTAAAGDGQAHLSGPRINLPARTAQTICMTFHELTTNALKFGALSEPDGELYVSWRQGAGELAISWQERGVPLLPPPTRRGVGMEQLERVLPYETGARVSGGFSGGGFGCTIVLENLKSAGGWPAGNIVASPLFGCESSRKDLPCLQSPSRNRRRRAPPWPRSVARPTRAT